MRYHLAIDIGASSGRHILASVENGKLELLEIYRFENYIKNENGTLVWDIEHLVESVIEGIATDPDGEVEYVVENVESEGPEIKALRYGDDFCIPTLTEDFDYADWFEGEWLTKSELEERIATEGWSREWVRDRKSVV